MKVDGEEWEEEEKEMEEGVEERGGGGFRRGGDRCEVGREGGRRRIS